MSNNQGSASLVSPALPDSASNDVYHSISVSRAVAYDGDQRYSRLQRDGLVSRRDKSTAHLQEESQPLRRNTSTSGIEPLGSNIKRRNGAESEEDCKIVHQLDPAGKTSVTKVTHGLDYKLPSSEDEDICPTCLDGNFMHVTLTNNYLFFATIYREKIVMVKLQTDLFLVCLTCCKNLI